MITRIVRNFTELMSPGRVDYRTMHEDNKVLFGHTGHGTLAYFDWGYKLTPHGAITLLRANLQDLRQQIGLLEGLITEATQ